MADKSGMARCECCGLMARREPYPAEWTQTGMSRWGHKHDRDGIAWWCPVCTTAKCDTGAPRCGKKIALTVNKPAPRQSRVPIYIKRG